jgi:hypothetical protein
MRYLDALLLGIIIGMLVTVVLYAVMSLVTGAGGDNTMIPSVYAGIL